MQDVHVFYNSRREDPRDVLILHSKYDGENLETLPKGSVIGTSSLRRTAQLCRNSPHLKIHNIRGNLNTRLKKLDEDKIYSGIVLAAAGVKRMKWEERIREYLEPSKFLYAVGQGAIAVECRSGDDMVIGILEKLNHIPTILRVVCERSFLKTLGKWICKLGYHNGSIQHVKNLSWKNSVYFLFILKFHKLTYIFI